MSDVHLAPGDDPLFELFVTPFDAGDIAAEAAQVFRDYAIDGSSSSGAHRPVKAEIRALFQTIDDAIANAASIGVFGASGPSSSEGLVPDPGSTAGTIRFLCEDATWKVPPPAVAAAYANVSDGVTTAAASGADVLKFYGDGSITLTVKSNDPTHGDAVEVNLSAANQAILATAGNVFIPAGSPGGPLKGLVPAPPSTPDTTRYLREDGTWVVPPSATGSVPPDNSITFAKIQQVTGPMLIGRRNATTGNTESLGIGASLSMAPGTPNFLQRAALTGDVTAPADSNTTTIAAAAVTAPKLAHTNVFSDNMVPNGMFTNGVMSAGVTPPVSWNAWPGTWTVEPRAGAPGAPMNVAPAPFAAKIPAAATLQSSQAQQGYTEIQPNERLYIGGWLVTDGAITNSTMLLRVQFLNADGTATNIQLVVTPTTTWQKFEAIIIAPSTACGGRLNLLRNLTAVDTANIWITGIYLSRAMTQQRARIPDRVPVPQFMDGPATERRILPWVFPTPTNAWTVVARGGTGVQATAPTPYMLKIPGNASTTAGFASDEYMPVTGGETIYISALAAADAGWVGSAFLAYEWLAGDGTKTIAAAIVTISPTTTWTKFEAQAVLPATACGVRFRISRATSSSGDICVTHCQLERYVAASRIFLPSGPTAGIHNAQGLVPAPGATAGTTKFLREDATWQVPTAAMPNVTTTDRLLGRDTAGAGPAEELTVAGGLEFSGAGGIQRSALAGGDVTADAASAVAVIGQRKVSADKLMVAGFGNLVPNPSFQLGDGSSASANSWSETPPAIALPTGWTIMARGGVAPLSVAPSRFVLAIPVDAAVTREAKSTINWAECAGGEQFWIGGSFAHDGGAYTAGQFRLQIEQLLDDGTTTVQNFTVNPTSTWARFEAKLTINAAACGVRLTINRPNHATDTAVIYATGLFLERYATAARVASAVPVMLPSGPGAAGGTVPAPSTTAGTRAFLAEDATWKEPRIIGAATGGTSGDMGAGTLNTSAGVFKNGAEYLAPTQAVRVLAAQVDLTTTGNTGVVTWGPVVAGKRYSFRAVLHVTAHTTDGFKVRLQGTGGMTATFIVAQETIFNAVALALLTSQRVTALTTVTSYAGPQTSLYVVLEGGFQASAAGTFAVQCGKNSDSGAGNITSVLAGSTLQVWEGT